MKKSVLYILIGLIIFSFSCESVKLVTKIASKSLMFVVNDFCSNDDASETDDNSTDNDIDTFLEYDFLNTNIHSLYPHNIYSKSMVYKDVLQTSGYFGSIDFPPEFT